MDQAILNYLGSFLLYTGIMIGIIYLVYALVHKGVYSGAQPQGSQGNNPTKGKATVSNLPSHLQGFLGIRPKSHDPQALCVESRLALEPRKNIYILRTGNERFAVATTLEGTQFLTRLESATPSTVTDLHDPQYQEDLLQADMLQEEGGTPGEALTFFGTLQRQMGNFITAPQRLRNQGQQQTQTPEASSPPRC